MDTHQRRVGFRFNSVRSLLALSLFEFSRLLNRSHYTLSAIERSIRYPTDDLMYKIVELAAQRDVNLSYDWMIGEEKASLPTSTRADLREKIMSEHQIETFMVYCDDAEHRKKFGHRLAMLLKNMSFSPFQFARWAHVSVDTVHQWLDGNSLPKRDTMRLIVNRIKNENIPLSLEWLCSGKGILEPFQYVAPSYQNNLTDEGIIQIKVDSSLYEPHISKNTKLSAYAYPSRFFVTNWPGFYLYSYQGQWVPVQLEGTRQLDIFHIMSLHQKLADRVFLKNMTCNTIYPIIYLEKMYPPKLEVMRKHRLVSSI